MNTSTLPITKKDKTMNDTKSQEKKCDCCDCVFAEDDDIYTLGDDKQVCQECYDDKCITCESCGEMYLEEDTEKRGSCWEDEVYICKGCIDDASMEETYDSMRREQSDEAVREWNYNARY